jgi:hypothetical protein
MTRARSSQLAGVRRALVARDRSPGETGKWIALAREQTR